jgi:dihydroorotase
MSHVPGSRMMALAPVLPRLLIRGGLLLDPVERNSRRLDLWIADGSLVAMTPPGESLGGFEPDEVIDASGLSVCPGLIDLSARLREPGFEYKATLESEMRAAIAGGVTRLVCPPDTDPPLDEPGLVEMLKHRARNLAQAHVHPLGALTVALKGEQLTEMAELTEAGCVGFSQGPNPVVNTQVLLRAMQYARTFDFSVWLYPMDPWIGRTGIAHSGPVSSRMGLPGIPAINETIALQTVFELMRSTGARVHICRLSSAGGVALVRQARREGLRVTADVAVHHLHLIDIDIADFDANYRVLPPFRGQRDRDAIREGLLDGTIDAICSDHAPVDDDAKQLPFGEAEPGVTALELLLPLTIKWAREAGLTIEDALRRLTVHPASVLGRDAGQLSVGAQADICIFDPNANWSPTSSQLYSQGANTPYAAMDVQGRVHAVLVDGRCVFDRSRGGFFPELRARS